MDHRNNREFQKNIYFCLINYTEAFDPVDHNKLWEIFKEMGIPSSLVAQLVKNPPAMQEAPVQFLGQEVPWRKDRPATSVFLDFPDGSDGKESTCKVGDLGSIPGSWKIPWKRTW